MTEKGIETLWGHMHLLGIAATDWAFWGPWLMSFATAVMLGSHLLRVRRENVWAVVEEQKKIASAHEETIKLLQSEVQKLTVLAEDARKDVFRQTVLVADYKQENERLGLLVLTQQRRMDQQDKKILDQQSEINQLRIEVADHEQRAQQRRDSDDERRKAR